MYIHELKEWPNFIWDDAYIAKMLMQLRHQQGRLIGGMEAIGFSQRDTTILRVLTEEVVKSSEIEGEILNPSSVRSSVARHLGIKIAGLGTSDKHVDGVVEMMVDATQKFAQPLTKARVHQWHRLLFPFGRSGFTTIRVGQWRKGPVQVISGRPGEETVHFEGPAAHRLDHEMKLFLDWLNNDPERDPVLKAAIAHLWFVTIHPFDDGNGRIGRAIADLLLARSEHTSDRFYSLSAQIQKERKHYYAALEKAQKGGLDITSWIEWFFSCLGRALEHALSTLDIILEKTRAWEAIGETPLNERQRKMINKILDGLDSPLTTSKWAKITKCSQDTAHRDIHDLMQKGFLEKEEKGGRSTSYRLILPHSTQL